MRFVCDAMLGKLARYLRLFGLDAPYIRNSRLLAGYTHQEEDLYFLTRRRGGVFNVSTVHIRSDRVRDQLSEIKELIRPYINRERLLNRCIECNLELTPAQKDGIEHLVPEFVFHHYDRFMICPGCKRVFWGGSHVENMGRLLEEVLA